MSKKIDWMSGPSFTGSSVIRAPRSFAKVPASFNV
jgi:hypothetical protein